MAPKAKRIKLLKVAPTSVHSSPEKHGERKAQKKGTQHLQIRWLNDNPRSFEKLSTNHFPKQTGNKTAEK